MGTAGVGGVEDESLASSLRIREEDLSMSSLKTLYDYPYTFISDMVH